MTKTTRNFRAVSHFGVAVSLDNAVPLRSEFVPRHDAENLAQPAQYAETVEADLPRQLGPWVLKSLLSDGAATQIYQAASAEADGNHGASYAVKLLRNHGGDNSNALERLRREWLVGRSVAHRHVISMLSGHVHRAPYYVVMPWIDGVNMATHLAAHGRMTTPVALWIVRQAAQALEALHTAGYLHGDVKPANLLVDRSGHVTLIDLGSVRRWPDEPTLADEVLDGTPLYLSPESFAGQPSDSRSDLYSLGMTLFEMLAGRLPDMGTNLSAVSDFKRQGLLPSVRAFAPQVPSEVSGYIRYLTARQPLRRPHHAREVVQSLLRLEIATLRERVPV